MNPIRRAPTTVEATDARISRDKIRPQSAAAPPGSFQEHLASAETQASLASFNKSVEALKSDPVVVQFRTNGLKHVSQILSTPEAARQASTPLRLPVVPAAPGILSFSQNGLGQGVVMNLDYSVADTNHPAPGSYVSIFATGCGLLASGFPDGQLIRVVPYPETIVPVAVTIRGKAGTSDLFRDRAYLRLRSDSDQCHRTRRCCAGGAASRADGSW